MLAALGLPSSYSYYVTPTLAILLPAVSCVVSASQPVRQEIVFCLTLDAANINVAVFTEQL